MIPRLFVMHLNKEFKKQKLYEVCNLKKRYNIDCVLNFRCPSKETVKVLKDHVVHMQRNSGECSQKKCDDTGARPLGSKLTIIVLSDVVLYLYSYPNYFSIFFSNHVENAHLIFIKFVIICIRIWTSIVIVCDCKVDFLFCHVNF